MTAAQPIREVVIMRGMFEPWHVLVLAAVIAVLFGGKRLPDAARGLGRSMRIFKSEIRQLSDDAPPAPRQSSQPSPAPQQSSQPSSAPLEGRVLDGDAMRSSSPAEQRRDA
jgi:sec-independent protein translocase protein TatA